MSDVTPLPRAVPEGLFEHGKRGASIADLRLERVYQLAQKRYSFKSSHA